MEQIKNEQLTVEISSLGAELQSIKDAQGNEYLWDGDEQYWNRHSPILFPIVCGLWKDTYRIDGKEYQLGRHGFARDTEFQLISKGEDRITYALTDSEATLKDYPYHFNLAITYRLEGKKLHVIWHVANTDDKQIFFQIGGHPAFLVPGAEKGKELKGQLKFDNPEPERLYGNVGGCVVEGYHMVFGHLPRTALLTMPSSSTAVSLRRSLFSTRQVSLTYHSTSRLLLLVSGVLQASMLHSCASNLGMVFTTGLSTTASSRTSIS